MKEAKRRISYLFDEFEEIVVNFSGGKDSTIVFHLVLEEAKKRNRLPVNVLWIDQEAEWTFTMEYVKEIMYMKEVKPYWKNPRKEHNVEGLKKSIKKFGFYAPIVLDKNNVIIVGHGRYKALKDLDYKEVDVIVRDDLKPKQAKEMRISDNRLSEQSNWEEDYLRQELAELDSAIGYFSRRIFFFHRKLESF